MFWIGLIVGLLIPVIVYFVAYLFVTRIMFDSPDEYWDAIGAVHEAVCNRESEIQVWHHGELINSVTLEER